MLFVWIYDCYFNKWKMWLADKIMQKSHIFSRDYTLLFYVTFTESSCKICINMMLSLQNSFKI